jgi:hypothetical protein
MKRRRALQLYFDSLTCAILMVLPDGTVLKPAMDGNDWYTSAFKANMLLNREPSRYTFVGDL